MFNFGSIVLVPFPFTDLTSAKLRPALVVSRNNSEDVVVCFITSKIPDALPEESFLISSDDKGFSATGLKVTSVIRFDTIATLSKSILLGELGAFSVITLKQMKPHFEAAFGFSGRG